MVRHNSCVVMTLSSVLIGSVGVIDVEAWLSIQQDYSQRGLWSLTSYKSIDEVFPTMVLSYCRMPTPYN